MIETLITILGSSAVSSVVGYIFARRKNIAEAQKSELDLVTKAITIWRQQATELMEEVVSLREENKALRLEISKIRCINAKIVKALDKLTPDNIELVVTELKKKIENEGN
jgi:regulator of replication initiation timing